MAKCVVCGDIYDDVPTYRKYDYCDKCRRRIYRSSRRNSKTYKILYERDKGICQICKKKVHFEYTRGNPLSGTIDHIKAIDNEGHSELTNLQLVHEVCNRLKGHN
jgi:5-methylcytosine-specific restriction endonuclease McrA